MGWEEEIRSKHAFVIGVIVSDCGEIVCHHSNAIVLRDESIKDVEELVNNA